MREERFPWGLGAILVLAIVGGIGFWVGSSNATPVIVPVAAPVAPAPVAPAPAPITPIYPAYAPHGGGFPLFPLFFGLIFLVVIFKFIRHAAWGGYQRGGPWSGTGPGGATYGPGGPGGPGGFSGRNPSTRHHGGHGWYGPRFDADASMDEAASEPGMSQQGSETTGSASDAGTRSRRPGFWNGRDVPPMVDEMFQRWHSRMHAEPSAETKTEPDASPTNEGGSLNIPPTTPPVPD